MNTNSVEQERVIRPDEESTYSAQKLDRTRQILIGTSFGVCTVALGLAFFNYSHLGPGDNPPYFGRLIVDTAIAVGVSSLGSRIHSRRRIH